MSTITEVKHTPLPSKEMERTAANIKNILIDLAVKDELPLDMNGFDETLLFPALATLNSHYELLELLKDSLEVVTEKAANMHLPQEWRDHYLKLRERILTAINKATKQ